MFINLKNNNQPPLSLNWGWWLLTHETKILVYNGILQIKGLSSVIEEMSKFENLLVDYRLQLISNAKLIFIRAEVI